MDGNGRKWAGMDGIDGNGRKWAERTEGWTEGNGELNELNEGY